MSNLSPTSTALHLGHAARRVRSLDSHWRIAIALILGLATLVLLPHRILFQTRLVVSYDVGSVALLAMAWTMMNFAPPSVIHADCFRQDAGRTVIFLVVMFAAFAGLSSILIMLGSIKGDAISPAMKLRHIVVSVVAVVSSWFMLHTTFALHYARRYYQDKTTRPHAENGGGLDFPEKGEPDYWDFAYYSFVIGMTSQVSDVGTTSRGMRRLTLLHSILSFFFNTAILALAINIVAGGL